jgi:hypothetical protein
VAVLDWLQQLLGGGGGQGMVPSSADQSPSDTSGIVLPYLQKVLSGEIAAGGLPHNTYDPNRSFAANALDPRGMEGALGLALGFTGGGLGTRPYVPGAGGLRQMPIEDTVKLFHGTSPEGAAAIKESGLINGPVFLTSKRQAALDYADGGPVLAVEVPKKDLKIDFDLPGGHLLGVEEANQYAGKDGWTIDDYLRGGHSVAVDYPVKMPK